jgi:hypothetical protein
MKAVDFKFEPFAVLGRGIPFLRAVRNTKTMRIHWGDGTLRDYTRFQAEILAGHLNTELEDAWKRQRHKQCRNAKLFLGGVHGSALFVSNVLGEELLAAVLRHFTATLEHLMETSRFVF